MNRRTVLLGLTGAACTRSAADPNANKLTAEEQRAGWRLLFDGRTYNGWENPADRKPPGDSWTIEDGCLKALPHPKIGEDLVSRETFRDFELAFDWKLDPGGNSGVKYLIQRRLFVDNSKLNKSLTKFEDQLGYEWEHKLSRRDQIGGNGGGFEYVVGLEFQLIDDSRHRDAQRGPLYRSGGLYSLVPPTQSAAKPVGEWNTGRLLVQGDHVEHWLNGLKVMETSLDNPAIAEGAHKRWSGVPDIETMLARLPQRDCPISLQNHGDTDTWFRNLKVRRL